MNIVTAKELIKEYGKLRAVNSINFDIGKGECFGFLGPNGAGKSTVMGIIHCYMPPTSGEVRVFDINVTNDPSMIKSKLGVMPQDNNLDPDLSVLENLIVYARYFNISKKEAMSTSKNLLNFIEMESKANVNIKDLSGGMQRRLLLARALINHPEIIILDEPTTGLDPHSRHAVWDQLSLLKSRGITLILTTHYMEEAENICDRVAIMDAGKIIATDSPSKLIAKYGGNLESVYLTLTGHELKS